MERRSGPWFELLAILLILAAVALSGCFPLPLGCRSTWFRRCSPMPQGTAEDCARGLLPEPSLPYWSQVPEENWTAAIRACRACMTGGDSAATCSKRMWGR